MGTMIITTTGDSNAYYDDDDEKKKRRIIMIINSASLISYLNLSLMGVENTKDHGHDSVVLDVN